MAILSLSLTGSAWGQDAVDDNQPNNSAAQSLGMVQISGNDLLSIYQNQTVTGVFNSYIADIRAGIPPERFSEAHFENATTLYKQWGRHDYSMRGVYSFKRDEICYTYKTDRWDGTYCFYVFKQDGCYYHFSVNRGFPVTQDDFKNWTSMGSIKEENKSCLPNIA